MDGHHAVSSIQTGLLDQIALIFALALAGGFIAAKLKLPPIVGYLVAGMAVGPFTPGFVADRHLIEQLGEVGVVLLMFGVGLHFSPKDLMAVKNVAVPGALIQSIVTTAIGTGLGILFGWGLGGGIVLGLCISVASTVVLIRALMAREAMDTPEGQVAVGWLIVEDLLSVLILVLLPVIAGALGGHEVHRNAYETMADALFTEGDSLVALFIRQVGVHESLLLMIGVAFINVALLLLFVFTIGKKISQWLLAQVERTKSEELFTLFVVAIGMFVAFGAKGVFGLSVALGAFLAGIMLGDSILSHRIGQDVRPIRDLFGIIFFTAVGMLFDPSTVTKMPVQLIIVLALIMVGKPLIAGAIVYALKKPLGTAIVVGAALGQIGEFSFILAVQGQRLGLVPDAAYQLIITGAILSIALNPVMFWIADKLKNGGKPVVPDALPEAA